MGFTAHHYAQLLAFNPLRDLAKDRACPTGLRRIHISPASGGREPAWNTSLCEKQKDRPPPRNAPVFI
jgi:hypothetical protein